MHSRWPPDFRPVRILVLEPDAEGHALEWLQHLASFVTEESSACSLSIAAPRALCDALAKSLPAAVEPRVGLLALHEREERLCCNRSLIVASFSRLRTMRRYLHRSGADAGFFLSIDLLSLPLALGFGLGSHPVSGILFRPSIHYGALGDYRPSWREKVRDLRKDVLYRLMLRNRHLSTVLSLDPFFPQYATSRYAQGDKVRSVPDPAFPISESTRPIGAPGFPPAGRLGLLLFGYLTERKGPLVVLDALKLLPACIANRIAVLFAGRTDVAIRDAIDARRLALVKGQPGLWLKIEDRRLERAELEMLVAQSHIVLAPYQRFVGSSGVLLWAAQAARPVLAQDFGLIGRLIRDHGLGAVADSCNPAALARAIEKMVIEGPQTFIDEAAAQRFAAARTPRRFAATILSSLGTPRLA
jgi:glycosyltransferase involved in cell wall biosynthesis